MKKIICLLLLSAACTVSKKDDYTQEVQAFVAKFAQSLSGTDEQLLAHFKTAQSKESVLAALRVVQNKELEYMTCEARFNSAIINFEEQGIRVTIPAQFHTVDLSYEETRDTQLVLWLAYEEGDFYINRLEGEAFYNDYTSFTNGIAWEITGKKELADRQVYFTRARELQQTYDSAIWYVHYNAKTYYYVVNGRWNNYFIYNNEDKTPATNYTMGLVDEDGNLIVPLDFDLVGTPGISDDDVVEVRKDGKVGYYSMEGKSLLPPMFDWILPYSDNDCIALAKQGDVTGWVNKEYTFVAGLPSPAATEYVNNYAFLPDQFTLGETTYSLAEIPEETYVAYGIVMPPAYLTQLGIFKEIEHGFVKGDIYNMSSLEYKKTEYSFLENVFDEVSAVITTFTTRYLEGREEFYKNNQVIFVDANRNVLATQDLPAAGDVQFKKISPTLLEVKSIRKGDDVEYYGEGDEEVMNLPIYSYFELGENFSLVPLESPRWHNVTEFVKLDSTYLQGDFVRYSSEKQADETIDFLPNSTLESMRNEILATYGFTFPSTDLNDQFKYRNWFDPRYTRYDEFWESMSEIDQHNVRFLETIVGTLDPGVAVAAN